ncbi:MAG: tetratricopeptide repeat protein [Candidatus Kapaibacterium sp.]
MHEIDPAFLVEAEKLLQEGKSREAAVLCTRGLAKYPEYYTAYAVLIRALDEMGDYEQMQEVYDSAPNVIKFNVKNDRLVNSSKSKQTIDTEVEALAPEKVAEESNKLETEIETEPEVILEEIPEIIEDDSPVNIEEPEVIESTEDETVEDKEITEEKDEETEELEEIEDIKPDLEKEIHQAIRNDELNPEVVSDLTKGEREEQEEIDIKETLTLAKIYEQQDAFEEALIIYKQLQEITSDKSKYADKILELQTLVDEDKK